MTEVAVKRTSAHRLLLLWGLALLVAVAGCGRSNDDKPPVYLIMIDTLRTDALSCYGGARPTPALDRFASQAVLFENCFAPCSWTLPSVASVWTGLYPFHHGTTEGAVAERKVVRQQELSPRLITLGEVFKNAGYSTFGISANGHIAEEFGFAQGFDKFFGFSFIPKDLPAARWKGLSARVALAQRRHPTFTMLFFFDPHLPYDPREPYITKYSPNWREQSADFIDHMTELAKKGYIQEHPEKIPVARALYDSEVAWLDEYLATALPALPGYDDAWVIITADHGESFGEEGRMLHGNNLRQPEVHVPLLIKMPNGERGGTRVAQAVSLVDILPTLAAICGMRSPPPMDGVSLLPALHGQKLAPRPLFMHLKLGPTYSRGMVRWPFKVILREKLPATVFDLADDAAEANDLREILGPEGARLVREADNGTQPVIRFLPRSVANKKSDAEQKRLRELGYLQ